ncbi:MAG: hypothetical protein K2V38_22685 [Gemmataceae bacterium]|nr:hypothetical protein [Gemmataceae bacterium]
MAKLSDWRPAGAGRHSLSCALPADGWNVQLVADKTDALACLVWELTLTRAGDAPDGFTLKAWARDVAERATGLLEPLKVLEVDADRGEAILRSTAPAKKGEAVAYYEVKLAGTQKATARRFTANFVECGRAQIAFALTHEVLGKLAGDIAG